MTLLLANWRLVLELVVVGLLVVYGATMRTQRDIARAEYSDFRRDIAIAAQAAAEEALKKTIADEKRKEEADERNLRLRSDLAVLSKRLRDARASSNFVPPAASCPERPNSAAFDRTLLERALQQLDSEIQGLIDEGDAARIDLDTAKRWAKDR
jgi:hypothetical protein